jgi:hypothetical protein
MPGAFDRVANVAAIHRVAGAAGVGAQNRNRELRVVLRRAARAHRNARLNRRQVQEAAAVERQALNLLARDHAVDGIAFIRNLRAGRFDVHDLGRGAHRHAHVGSGRCPSLNRGLAHYGPESLGLHADFILTGR